MSDAILLLAAVVFFLHRFFHKTGEEILLKLSVLLSAASMAICLLVLYSRSPEIRHVVALSPAASAGILIPENRVLMNGSRVGSLGEVLAKSVNEATLFSVANKEFHSHHQPTPAWRFWEAHDSYALESATGGLSFFPRRPIINKENSIIWLQMQSNSQPATRIHSVAGTETPTLKEFLHSLRNLPHDGVIPFQVTSPSPDGGEITIYYSPSPFPNKPGFSLETKAEENLNLSTFFLFQKKEGEPARIVPEREIVRKGFTGPDQLETDLEAHPANHDIYFGPDSMVIAKPRIFLLPRLYKNPFVTFVFALPGHIVRQVSQIPQLYVLFNFWDLVPQQHYVLDDPPSIPFFFFKLSSFFASFAFALGIWLALRSRWSIPSLLREKRMAFILFLTLLLQIADILHMRSF